MKDDFYFISIRFLSCRKNDLIEKIWNFQNLFLRFMTSHSGQQAITIHILSNISRSKGKLTMKFGQLIEYNKRNIFLQKLHRKWARETSSKSFFFQKNVIWGKNKWSAAQFQYISIDLNLTYNKNKLYKTLEF